MTLCNIKFMANNLIPASSWYSYSSQQSTYPFTNALHQRRSKYWLTNGNFEITANSNDDIYINDGSNKTVTLTAGTYTAGGLATEVQTQLNASSSNWTCSYSSTTRKFTINRTSGSATLRLSQTTNAAWYALGFTGAIDRSSPPFLADEPRIHTKEWFKMDIGVQTEIDFIGLIGPINEVFGLSSNAIVQVHLNNVDVWTNPAVTETITPTQRGILYHLTTENTYYRYVLLEIEDNLNPGGPDALKFGYLYIGGADQPTSTNIQRGFLKSQIDPSIILESENGTQYADLRNKYNVITGGNIALASQTDRRTIEEIAHTFGKHTPLFVSIDPLERVSYGSEDLTYYMYFNREPQYQHVFNDYYSISLDMREAI